MPYPTQMPNFDERVDCDVEDALTRAAKILDADEAWTFNFQDVIALAGIILAHQRGVEEAWER